jgi:hypothetical protein
LGSLALDALSDPAWGASPANGHSPHEVAIAFWHNQHPTPFRLRCVFGHTAQSITLPDGKSPPPFIVGALSVSHHHAFCACLQATTSHAFTTDYSWQFWPRAGNNTMYPCHQAGIDCKLGPQGSVDGEVLVQPSLPDGELSPQGLADQERRLLPAYTLTHLLHNTPCTCPLLSTLHRNILLNASMSHIFGTKHGGSCLASFILLSQTLLHPLPPHPDPP